MDIYRYRAKLQALLVDAEEMYQSAEGYNKRYFLDAIEEIENELISLNQYKTAAGDRLAFKNSEQVATDRDYRSSTLSAREADWFLERLGLNAATQAQRDAWLPIATHKAELNKFRAKLRFLYDDHSRLSSKNPYYGMVARDHVIGEFFDHWIRYEDDDSVTELVARWQTEAQQYESDFEQAPGSSFAPSYCLALSESDEIFEHWHAVEKQRVLSQESESYPYRLEEYKALVNANFHREAVRGYYKYLVENCQAIDEDIARYRVEKERFDYAEALHDYGFDRNVERELRDFSRAYGSDERNRNAVVEQVNSVVPTFKITDTAGSQTLLSDCQVLVWQYEKGSDSQLAPFELADSALGMQPVMVLYSGKMGQASFQKPGFLFESGVDCSLQYCPDSQSLMLAESYDGSAETDLEKFNPFVATHNAFDDSERYKIGEQLAQITGSDFDLDSPADVSSFSEQDITLQGDNVLEVDLCASGLSGHTMLQVNRTYGFMVLPLGFGSLHIADLAQFAQSSDSVTIKEITEDDHEVLLQPTMRFAALDYIRKVSELRKVAPAMQTASKKKQAHLYVIDSLHDLVDQNRHHLHQFDEKNAEEYSKLLHQLKELSFEIRKTIYQPPFIKEFKDSYQPVEQKIYLEQEILSTAAAEFLAVYNNGLKSAQSLAIQYSVIKFISDQSESNDYQAALAKKFDVMASGRTESQPINNFITGPRSGSNHTDYWQPPKVSDNGFFAPYSSIYFESLSILVAELTNNYVPQKICTAVEFDLVEGYLNPVIYKLVSSSEVVELEQVVRGELDGAFSNETVKALSPILPEGSEPGILKSISDNGLYSAFKTTFIRGPGAPALLENLINLGHQISLTSNQSTLLRHTGFKFRSAFALNILALRGSPYKSRAAQTRLASYLYVDSIARTRIAADIEDLSDVLMNKMYSPKGYAKFEGTVKVLDTALNAFLLVSEALNGLSSEDQKKIDSNELTSDDFKTLFQELVEGTENYSGVAQQILAVPGAVDFLKKMAASSDSKAISGIYQKLEKLVGTKSAHVQQSASAVTNGAAASRSLVNLSAISKVANGAAFVGSVAAAVKHTNAFAGASTRRDEHDMILSGVQALGAGATVGGLVLTSSVGASIGAAFGIASVIPVFGQALLLFGTTVSLGVMGFNFWWSNGGKELWYSNTYADFDEKWAHLSSDIEAYEYTKAEYGASPKLVQLFESLEDQYRETIVDGFEALAGNRPVHQQLGITTASVVSPTMYILWKLYDYFERRRNGQIDRDVCWDNMNWIGLANQIAFTSDQDVSESLSSKEYLDSFSLTDSEALLFDNFGRQHWQPTVVDEEAAKLGAQIAEASSLYGGRGSSFVDVDSYASRIVERRRLEAMYDAFIQLKAFANKYPESAFTALIWDPLVVGDEPIMTAEELAKIAQLDEAGLPQCLQRIEQDTNDQQSTLPSITLTRLVECWAQRAVDHQALKQVCLRMDEEWKSGQNPK